MASMFAISPWSQSDKYNLTTITSKCVALCYFRFVSDAGLNRGGVIGAITRPIATLQLMTYFCGFIS